LQYLVEKLKDGECVVFLFHGIVFDKNLNEKNAWTFNEKKFDRFLDILKNDENIKVINIKQYIDLSGV
jgi:hypothetical protein